MRTGLLPGMSAIQGMKATVAGMVGSLSAMLGGITLAGTAGWGVKLAAEAETAKIGFTALLGSGKAATEMLQQIRDMGKETPFEFGELRGSAQTLIAFGQATESILPTLAMLGDISSGSGKNIQELTLIYGQAAAAGRLMTQDMNQLTSAGIPILQSLADHFGVTKTAVRKMVEEGKIDFETFANVMKGMTDKGGLYFGQMDEKSKSLEGRWSTLKDTAGELALAVGEKLMPAMKSLTETGISVLEWLKNLNPATVKSTASILAMVGAFGAAIAIVPRIISAGVAIVKTLRAIAIGQSIAQALAGPAGWTTLAVGLVAAAGAGLAVNAMFADVATAADGAAGSVRETRKEVVAMAAAFDLEGAKAQLKSLTEEAKEVKKHFADARKAIEGRRGVFTSALERGAVGTSEALAKAGQEGLIQKELAKIHAAEMAQLKRIEDREREVKEAIEKKEPIEVTERRI